jgi:GAF domain-containing protein
MKRRSKAGVEPIKGRRGKTPERKRCDAPKASAALNEETAVARLTSELREAVEQQSATSEVLRVISSYPDDPQPIFQAMLKNAVRLCDALFGTIYRWDGDALHGVAWTPNTPPSFVEARKHSPHRAGQGPIGRMIATKTLQHVVDAREIQSNLLDPTSVAAIERVIRTGLVVPMLRENELIGAFILTRGEVRPFTDKQIELVKNFAAQAVIAIENARLLNELRQRTTDLTEALGQQTATSEVLQVISSSPGDLQPVFATMLEKAVHICDATFGNIYRWDGDALQLTATHNTPPAYAEYRKHSPFRADQDNAVARMITSKKVVHVFDAAANETYARRDPTVVAAVELGRIRSSLVVPMLKEDELIGAFIVSRQEVRPFAEKQIALITNFAAQAVIAIENARLLNELRQRTTDLTEALEQQTATSDVLQVISRSPGELEPVFTSMLASATRICEAKFGNLLLREGEAFRWVAWYGEQPYVPGVEARIIRTDVADIPLSRIAATKQRVHIADLRQERAYKAGFAPLVALVDEGGARTLLIVPMLRELVLIGAIAIYRQEVRPFTEKQIALVENFAAQAVIAIENTRLLRELRERTDDVVKLNQELEQRVADQVGEIERMGRLRRFLPPQVADLIVASGKETQLAHLMHADA